MPKQGGFKRAVRARMKKTGESYVTAKAAMEGLLGPSADEALDDGYDPFMTLEEAGIDEDDLPMYRVNGQVVDWRTAGDYLVEQGLADPELFDED